MGAEHWADFSVATAGAGAALAGLLFVALSINLERILAGYGLATRAGRTLVLVGTPLVIALLVLVPAQSDTALGTELLAVGVASGGVLAWLNPLRWRASQQPLLGWIFVEVVPALLLSVSTILGGLGALTDAIGGLYWLPLGVIAAFIGAMLNAWVLLVEILR